MRTMLKEAAGEYHLVGYRIVSPFHLVALLAYALRLERPSGSLKVIVVTSPGPWNAGILSHQVPRNLDVNVTFVEETELHWSRAEPWVLWLALKPVLALAGRLAPRRTWTVCGPSLAALRLSASSLSAATFARPVVIDEGMGSYNRALNLRREATRQARGSIRQYLLWRSYQLVDLALPCFGGRRISLFAFKRGVPTVDEHVAASYKRVFEVSADSRDEHVHAHDNVVLLLPQPFVEMELCGRAQFMAVISRLAEIARDMGMLPLVKPHPAEDRDKYEELGMELIEYEGSVEELFASRRLAISEIWGFTSTSLVTGAALYGLRARRVHLPWNGTNLESFEGMSRALFARYTEPLDIRGAL